MEALGKSLAFCGAWLIVAGIGAAVWYLYFRKRDPAVAADKQASIHEQAEAKSKVIDLQARNAIVQIETESDEALLRDVNSHKPGGSDN